MLTRGAVAIFWLFICLAGLLCLRMLKPRLPRGLENSEPSSGSMDRSTKGLLAGVAIIVFFVLVIALVSPPNVWDAMEYHLPRVTMWMSNHSVRFFATPDYAQLVFGPWAEFAMMHADILGGGDRYVNLIEFFSFLGSLVGVSLIAKLLGAGPRGQILAAVVCATIPEGILEASGPMNTYVVSFWIMTTVVFLMCQNDDPAWLNTICVGLSAGLAILTKGDAYVYLPFLVLACWWMGSTAARIRFLKRCAVFVLLILAINGPQYLRSGDLTGSPLGLPFPDGGPRLHWMVDHIGPREILANTVRNISLHVVTPSEAVNARIEKLFRLGIEGIGVDPDDPREVWFATHFRLNHFSAHEIHAGNPLHLLLLLVSIGLVLTRRKDGVRREAIWYALGIVAAFLFFCGLLRWQIYASRHHLPLFVLGSALAGLVLERYFSRRVATAVCLALFAYASLFLFANRLRSLVPWSRVDDVYHPRAVLYFSDQHEKLASTYIAAADAVNKTNCGNIAIDSYTEKPFRELNWSPKSFYVYPLLALIHANGRTRNVWYTGVDNLTSRYAYQENHPPPCAVICFECDNIPTKWEEYKNVGGRASVFDYIVIFSASGNILNSGSDAMGAQ
jgi:hypothetical protein